MTNLKHLSIFLFLFTYHIWAQPKCYFEHYGTKDGMPQHTVMSMLQDRKGQMWFSTWNGLSKFDGYKFYSYRILSSNTHHSRSNRIDKMWEDKYGYIWVLPYDKEPHRFDPRTETFTGLHVNNKFAGKSTPTENIFIAPSGKVWLITESEGCICVTDSSFNMITYNKTAKNISADKVYNIYEDSELNSWIMSDNGLYRVDTQNNEISGYFVNTEQDGTIGVYSAMETEGEIWFGTDKGKIQIYDKKRNRFDLLETETKSPIKFIQNINNNHVLIISTDAGFCIYHKPTKIFTYYNKATLKNMRSDTILSYYIDKAENVWLEMDCMGISKLNTANRDIKHFEVKVEHTSANIPFSNFFVFEDLDGRVWVYPRGGGFSLYDPVKDILQPFYNEPFSASWRFSNLIHAAFSDKQGNLWLSTHSHGLEKIVFPNDVFQTTIVDPNTNSSISNEIRCIYEDHDMNLWVSTKGGKIYVYDSQGKQKGYLCKNGKIEYGIPVDGFCYCIMQDKELNIWVGTKGNGIYKLAYNKTRDTYMIKQYQHNPKETSSLSSNNIYSIFQDKNGRIWIGTYGGGLNLIDTYEEGKFFNKKNLLKDYPLRMGSQIRIISSDKNGNVCIGTTLGLIVFSPQFNSPEDIQFTTYSNKPEDNGSLSGNDIYDICTTKKGETFLATFGGGIDKIAEIDEQGFPLTFKAYTTKEGLPSDVTLTITEDPDEKLWVTTEGNLSTFDPVKETFETYSDISRLIQRKNFSEGAHFGSKTGTVYAGFSRGFLSIQTNRIIKNTFSPYITLSALKVDNKPISINEESSLNKALDDLENLKLNHKQNSFSIEFAALDFVDPENITYAYMLEGFDKDWIVIQNQHTANYANMHPGNYLFKVRSTNSDGIWTDNEHILPISITPSFWQTRMALLLYIILFILLLFIILRTIFIFARLKDKIKLEQEQTEMKTRFFMDISHEIRTPLTMIVSPIEDIVDSGKVSQHIKGELQLVLKNTNRMLRMVNQILDFRKIQKQELNIQETSIGLFVSEICSNFEITAEEQNVQLNVNNNVGDDSLWVDRDGFEKLLYNLLSNAFKYTPSGKAINIDLNYKDGGIVLTVRDEGTGMTKDIQNKLFKRFTSFNKDKSKPSTGIGLSIVKEVADKHKAKISVSSVVDKGSSFSILFQKGITHYGENIALCNPVQDNVKISDTVPDIKEDEQPEEIKQTILIVEDDDDLRGFIKDTLTESYSVLEANNGKEGYETAVAQCPDFILSDIMMPEVDGIELLQMIRENDTTSHIPFILLTAKTNIESKLDGLTYGADDYITKPFSVKYLKARIKNIMQIRHNLYRYYNKDEQVVNTSQKKEQDVKLNPKDELFINQTAEIIENNIDNSEFLVEDLVSEMAMSRTVFFKKVKSLTGLAPIEFIREIRIKHAAKMMRDSDYTIKEIAFMVGFSDTKYFSQCFKQTFGVTPSSYRKNNLNQC